MCFMKVQKHVWNVFLICKLTFLTSMLAGSMAITITLKHTVYKFHKILTEIQRYFQRNFHREKSCISNPDANRNRKLIFYEDFAIRLWYPEGTFHGKNVHEKTSRSPRDGVAENSGQINIDHSGIAQKNRRPTVFTRTRPSDLRPHSPLTPLTAPTLRPVIGLMSRRGTKSPRKKFLSCPIWQSLTLMRD